MFRETGLGSAGLRALTCPAPRSSARFKRLDDSVAAQNHQVLILSTPNTVRALKFFPASNSPCGCRFGLFVGLLGLLALLGVTGCLRVGLPEYVGSGGGVDSGVGFAEPLRRERAERFLPRLLEGARAEAPWIVLRRGRRAFSAAEDPARFGHQYFLGFIPLTSVYLQHDLQSLALESAAEKFHEAGYRVAFAPEHDESLLPKLFPESYVLDVSLENIRLNAFDLLVVRLADLSGELRLDVRSPFATDAPVRSLREPLERSEYRRFAHAPALANMLEQEINDALARAGGKLPSMRALRFAGGAPQSAVSEDPTVILAARFSAPPAPGTGEALAQSYGYQSRPAFSNTALLRIVQRGIEAGVEADGRPAVSLFHRSDARSLDVPPSTVVVSRVLRLAPTADGLELVLSLELADGSRRLDCEMRPEAVSEMDGGLVVALERGAERVARRFFGGAETEMLEGERCVEARNGIDTQSGTAGE